MGEKIDANFFDIINKKDKQILLKTLNTLASQD